TVPAPGAGAPAGAAVPVGGRARRAGQGRLAFTAVRGGDPPRAAGRAGGPHAGRRRRGPPARARRTSPRRRAGPPGTRRPGGGRVRAPRVAVGVPVWNGERHLEDCLDSLLAQTYDDIGIVISDNASTDRTAAICRAYAARDERI